MNWKTLIFLPLFALFGAVVVGGAYLFADIYKTDISAVVDYKPKLTTQFFDARGRLIANVFDSEHRLYVPFDEIPSRIIEAIVAIEDTAFFEHIGINFEAIFRAAVKVAIAGKAVEGASTITQQVVKNFLLSRDKTIERKAKEAVLAIKVEQYLTKEQILERYLNEIFFGHGYHGIKTAAQGYFRKNLNELTLKEIAILVGLPRAPSFYDPTKHKLHALARANIVLSRMHSLGWISDEEHNVSIAEDPKIYDDTRTLNAAPYAIDYIVASLAKEYPELKTGGYTVHTSLDLQAQDLAAKSLQKGYDEAKARVEKFLLGNKKAALFREYEEQLRVFESKKDEFLQKVDRVKQGEDGVEFEGRAVKDLIISEPSAQAILRDLNISKPLPPADIDLDYVQNRISQLNGAMIITQQQTGDILAMVGGINYEKSSFNRAFQAIRQTGSAFKPFLYLASFDLGYSPSSLIPDISRTYSFYDDNDEKKTWKPSNFEENYMGILTERQALVHSRNLATVNLVTGVGLAPLYSKLRQYGFHNLSWDLAAALGSNSMSLVDLSRYYTIISNYGEMTEPRIVKTVIDRYGNARSFDVKKTFATKPEQAYLIIDVLKDAVKRGTGRAARVANIEVAGKTGTTNENKDGLFCGFTPTLQEVIWFGNDNYMQITGYETGGRIAAPVFRHFTSEYLKLHPELKRKFDIPDGVYKVELPNGETEIFTDISKPPKSKRAVEKEEVLF
ncbi:MAG: penicillin-binding protein 1A [Helicobacteraceae bacterium]